jgi:hypothetical protein
MSQDARVNTTAENRDAISRSTSKFKPQPPLVLVGDVKMKTSMMGSAHTANFRHATYACSLVKKRGMSDRRRASAGRK